MVSIDLKDAYLQVPVLLASRQVLRFVVDGTVYQFRALCFSLSTAPQVFTRVMAPVSVMLHPMGVRILRYLDNWLILASSRSEALWARDQVLSLCNCLSIVINEAKSFLQPTHTATYLGMVIVSPSLRVLPSPERVPTLLPQITKFLSYRRQNVVAWHCLLGRLSSLCHLVPRGSPSNEVSAVAAQRSLGFPPEIESDLLWWSDAFHLLAAFSLASPQPDLPFWSDTSDQGLGGEPSQPICLGSLVGRGAELLHQLVRALGHLPRPPPLWSFSAGSLNRSVYRQHHSPVVHPQVAPSLVIGDGDHIGAPVHHGSPERSSGFSEPSGPDHWLRMDLVSGGGRRVGEEVTGGSRSFCHLPQLSSSRVFLPLERSDNGRDGYLSSILGWAPSLRFSAG